MCHRNPHLAAVVGACALLAAGAAHAVPFTVQALANSSSGGTGLATLALTAGQSFSVSAGADDLWSAGALPRFSNANGLTGNRFATGSDESGQPAGTLIGQNFGTLALAGLSAPFGTLVGRIDSGAYFVVGTSFSGVASTSGTLNLFYWDSNAADNTGSVVANVALTSPVPEPDIAALMLAGLGALGALTRRRRAMPR